MGARETNANRCVQCGSTTNQLFVLYSPGNMHLMKCDNCKSTADEYIECEVMIVLIDLILHRRQAYTHLLYNLLDTDHLSSQDLMWKTGLCFLLFDAYRFMLLRLSEKQSSMSFSSTIGICLKTLMDVSLGNIMFLCALRILSRVFLRSSAGEHRYGFKDLLFAIIISSYFKIFLVCMMVWEFPSTVIFIIDLFVLSSNAVAIKGICKCQVCLCLGFGAVGTTWMLPVLFFVLGWQAQFSNHDDDFYKKISSTIAADLDVPDLLQNQKIVAFNITSQIKLMDGAASLSSVSEEQHFLGKHYKH